MTVPGEPTPCAIRNRAACPAQTRRLDRTTCRLRGHWAFTDSRPCANVRRLIHRLAHLGCGTASLHASSDLGWNGCVWPWHQLPIRGAVADSSAVHVAHSSAIGVERIAAETCWCVERKTERGPTVDGCFFGHRQIGIPHIPIWGLGGAAAGLSFTTAARRGCVARKHRSRNHAFVSQGSAFLQQRGRACVERKPCPDGIQVQIHTTS
jgi:hypothetical protein